MNFKLSLLAGLACLAMCSSVHAADIIAPNEVYDWSGPYIIGLLGEDHLSGHNSHINVNNFGGPPGTYDQSGNQMFGGIAVGYNYQIDKVVLGAELALRTGFNIDDGGAFEQYHNSTATQADWLGTVKGRVGVDLGAFMPYVTGGYAFSKITGSQDYHPGGTTTTWSDSKMASGYVVGAGLDYKVSERILVGIEYNYTDLGKVSFGGLDSTGRDTQIDTKLHSQSVMLRFGYRF